MQRIIAVMVLLSLAIPTTALGEQVTLGGLRRSGVSATPMFALGLTERPAEHQKWIFRHLVLVGTLAGAGASTVIAVNVGRGQPAIVLGGAAAGAYGGLVATAVHKSRRKEPVGVGTKIGIVAGAVGATVGTALLVRGLGGV